MSQMSLESSIIPVTCFTQECVVEVQPTVASVLSSAIQDIALALIGRAESSLSKKCMRRLADITAEHNEQSKRSHIHRCYEKMAQKCLASSSSSRTL